ncbi:MAG: hypothetical protein H0V26_00155 [Solirubrobacterales bacterium]|nr:hypothetical protein [Solirubrobacterales bacterium]
MRSSQPRPRRWAVTMGGMLAAAGGLAVLWRKPAARTAVQDAIPVLPLG